MKYLFTVLIHSILFLNCLLSQEIKDKRTPFEAVKYIDNSPYVFTDNEWVKLVSIADIDISEYIKLAVEYSPVNWKKAFHRWLHYMFDDMGIQRDQFIKVKYSNAEGIQEKLFELKKGNRELATTFHDSISKIRTVTRDINLEIPEEFNYLTKRIYSDTINNEYWISRADAMADLDYLECELVENYSYLKLNNFNYEMALDAIRSDIDKGIDKRDLALQLKMLLANFGDGHTRVSFKFLGKFKKLPFRVINHEDKFYAVNAESRHFFVDQYPIIQSINDIEIQDLYHTAQRLASKTTEGFIKSTTLSYLNHIELLLRLHDNYSEQDEVKISFYNDQSNRSISKQVLIGDNKLPALIHKHIFHDTIFDRQIGYLAFRYKMFREEDFIDSLHSAMKALDNTKALIIDVRGNSGGSRDALVNLMPYFISSPKVLNIARYRIDKNENLVPQNGFLERRFLYPLTVDNEILNSNANSFRKCVQEFRSHFKPEIVINDSLFSEYHYMVAFPKQENKIAYDKPVIIMIDEDCFSATDIFAAGIQQAPNVSLIGTTTGGGSGYADSKKLPFSGITLRASRMFSYQPNGKTYDGQGVVPDIKVNKTLSDKMGQTDTQLEYAIEYLRKNN